MIPRFAAIGQEKAAASPPADILRVTPAGRIVQAAPAVSIVQVARPQGILSEPAEAQPILPDVSLAQVAPAPAPAPEGSDPLPSFESTGGPAAPMVPFGDPANPGDSPAVRAPQRVQNPQREFIPPLAQAPDSALGQAAPAADGTAEPTLRSAASRDRDSGAVTMLMDPLAMTALQQAQSNAETLFDGLGGMPRPLTSLYLNSSFNTPGGLRRGDFIISPAVSVGTNFRSSSGDQPGSSSTEFYASISPEVGLTLGEPTTGRVINLQYFGTARIGEEGNRQSPYDQMLSLRGVLTLTKLTLGVGLQFSQLSGSDRDFGGQQVGRQLLGLALTGSYQYSPKTSVESDLTVPVRLFERGDNSQGVTSTTFFNYNYSPLTTFSAGVAVGTLTVENNQTQVFEQALLRLTYTDFGPLLFNGTFGVEFRDTGWAEQINPVFGAGATWIVREGTTFTLSADRRVLNSAAASGANYVSTSFALTATQRLGDFAQANASFGYENAAYDSERLANNQVNDREDNYVVAQGGVIIRFGGRWSASLLATYGNNQSDGNAVDFYHSLLQFTFAY